MGRDIHGAPLFEVATIAQKNAVPEQLVLPESRRVHILANLYQQQLLRGCENPNCNTATCRTYRLNNSERPLRDLSLASARAASFFLIDTEYPESHLCPFVSRNILGLEGKQRTETPKDTWLQDWVHDANQAALKEDSMRKDPSSFSQRLFNTRTVQDFFTYSTTQWLQKSSPLETVRRELVEAGERLSIAMNSFHRRNDTMPAVDAVMHATATLRRFFVVSMNVLLGRDLLYPSSLKDARQQMAEHKITDILRAPDPSAVRLASRLGKMLWDLAQHSFNVMETSSKSIYDFLRNQFPANAKEHLNFLILSRLHHSDDFGFLGLWMEPVFLKNWDEKQAIRGQSSAAAALYIWGLLTIQGAGEWELMWRLKILDPMNAAVTWMRECKKGRGMHILAFPWITGRQSQIECFRALCFYRMSDAVDEARLNMRLLYNSFSSLIHENRPPTQGPSLQAGRLQMAMSRYLTLQVNRASMLSDAMDELWGRQRRELFRPLRVKMLDAGELGVDQGGLAQEFIRLVWIEAFKPEYGLFSLDSRTHMAWFDPKSLEPLYKYEMLGLIMALAVFNGFTLPVTFPLALYNKLCGRITSFVELRDGWPDLADGLVQLLKWKDGDVSEVFLRSYTFTFEAYGEMVHIDMTKFKTADPFSRIAAMANSKSSEDNAPLVTNATRGQYIADYVTWLLITSVDDQYTAFAKGFHTIIDRDILQTITPQVLREITEGQLHIDTKTLEKVARYDAGYCWHKPYIRDFWTIVHSYDDEQKKRLLEFVTASDRVPVTGMESVDFIVQRHGGDTDSLPTSVTCFSRLLLPEYSSKEKLRQKLDLALENAQGFGLS